MTDVTERGFGVDGPGRDATFYGELAPELIRFATALVGPADAADVLSGAVVKVFALSQGAGRTQLDVHANIPVGSPGSLFSADVIFDEVGPVGPAPCDLIQLTVWSPDGVLRAGLRPSSGSTGGVDLVSVSPRIRERRPGAGPLTAMSCQVPPGSGMTPPPNRTSGPDATIRGAQPADVLLAWLAANPGAMSSGWVEFAQPDGTVTYAVDAGLGWASIVFVVPAGGGWQLGGSNSSGC
jgi:hypothetical protein